MVTKATLIKDPVHNTTQLKQTHYKYDARGNLEQESEFYNDGYLHTYYTYDSYGNMTTKTDANGNKLCYEYADATEKPYKSAYLTRVYKPDETTIANYTYDFDTGNKTMFIDPKENVFHYEYDAVNRLTKEWQDNSDPKIGVTRQIIYDDANSTVTLKFGNDTAGWQEGLTYYDPLFGKPTTLQRKINGSWVTQKQFEYDSNGRLAWGKDGMGHQTTYQYDGLDRKTQITRPNNSTIQFVYDDRIVISTDAKGNKKEHTYDLLDRLISVKESPDWDKTFYTTLYTYDTFYDKFGDKPVYHLVKTVNPKNAETVYTYDNLGRLIRTDYPQNLITAETYTYDNEGNIKTKTNNKGSKIFDYEFFSGYRLQRVTEPDGRTVSYSYDANDNPVIQSTNGAIYTYTYDARNRMTNLKAQLDGYSFIMSYDYDTFGNVIGMTYPGRNGQITYTYDTLNRLKTIPGFVKDCTYDNDNKLTLIELSNGLTNGYTYWDETGELYKIGTYTERGTLVSLDYSLDKMGNINKLNEDYYAYNGLNWLIWSGDNYLV
jgi:YD repeat-containing protein